MFESDTIKSLVGIVVCLIIDRGPHFHVGQGMYILAKLLGCLHFLALLLH